jgi:hypothetical protein
MTYTEPSRADLESGRGTALLKTGSCATEDDKPSDNRHRQRWTPADNNGRSATGHARCGAGSPRRNLASGRRGRLHCRFWQ